MRHIFLVILKFEGIRFKYNQNKSLSSQVQPALRVKHQDLTKDCSCRRLNACIYTLPIWHVGYWKLSLYIFILLWHHGYNILLALTLVSKLPKLDCVTLIFISGRVPGLFKLTESTCISTFILSSRARIYKVT